MKTISVLEVLEINEVLKEAGKQYVLKMKDTCGGQSLTLECLGEVVDAGELCDCINEYLKTKFMAVKPGFINPYNIVVL